jgi:hypothetical protein
LWWTIVVGDFSAHSHDVGYKNSNETGKTIDFILTNNIELLYKKEAIPAYLY